LLRKQIHGTASKYSKNKNKIDEFLISLPHNVPQVICITEHHLQTDEISNVNFGQYTLRSAFCRQIYKQGVCVYLYF
jgi:hypothetical protein